MGRSRMRGRLTFVALALCALALPGCGSLRIDPTGEHIFAQPVFAPASAPAYGAYPRQLSPYDDVAVMLAPRSIVAPVGSQVVLIAGVRDAEGYLKTNRRLEWWILPGGVGEFVAVQRNSFIDVLFGDFNDPRKISRTHAVGSTSRNDVRLDPRTTPTPGGIVARGQGWITVASPVEGTSYVVVNAPDVVTSNGRAASAEIHWFNPQSGVPTPTTSPAPTRQAASSIDLRVTGPTEAAVGSQVTFRVMVTNRGQSPATGLVVKDRFDEGLEHASGLRAIEKSMVALAPGQSFDISISFRIARAGRLCHRVTIVGSEGVRATGEGCVIASGEGPGPVVTPPPTKPSTETPLVVKTTGPGQRTAGDNAEFSIQVTNNSKEALTDVTVVDQCDPSLVIVGASRGFQRQGAGVAWTIPSLAAGQTHSLAVRCQCQAAAEKACNRVAATTPQGGRAEAEACLEIRPAPVMPANLKLTATGMHNPVKAGKTLIYVVLLQNAGQTVARQVTLTATVPQGMTFVPVGGGTEAPVHFHAEGPVVRFEPKPEVQPGETLTYRIAVQTRQAGQFTFHVEASSPDQPRPVVREEITEVSP
jgi:uncharacterized repeat protein (TIGR01451 family)